VLFLRTLLMPGTAGSLMTGWALLWCSFEDVVAVVKLSRGIHVQWESLQ
jgi:hypothetical protein